MADDLIAEEIALLERKKALLSAQTEEGQQKSSAFAATVMGINQGATFGFADEIAAGLGALAKTPFSEKSFGDLFSESLQVERQNLAAAEEQFPKTALGSTIAGGITTGGVAARGASNALSQIPRLPRIAAIGAAEGGLFGFGTATEDRLKSAGEGALLGAVAAPIASGVATAIGRVVKKLAAPVARAAGNTSNTQATRMVNRAMELDELTPATAELELRRLGPNATLADLGENLSGLARGVTSKPGRARTLAGSLLNSRQQTQQRRLLRAAGADFDIDDFKRTYHSAMNDRQSAAAPLYDEAYNTAIELTPALDDIIHRPSMVRALKKSVKNLADEGLAVEGSEVRVLDAAKRELDDQIGAAIRSGKRETARRLVGLKNELLGELDAQVPSYQQARNMFSTEASMRDSANLGRSLFATRVDLDDARFAVENMTEGELHGFRLGTIRGVIDKLESTPETRNAAQKLVESQRSRELLRLAFPDEVRLNRFLQTARAESQFSFTRNRVLGGSPTARIQEEVGDLSREAGIASAMRGGDALGMAVQLFRSIGMGDVSDETLEQAARLLFSRSTPPPGAIGQIARRIPLGEIPRQGAVAGAVGVTIGQQQE